MNIFALIPLLLGLILAPLLPGVINRVKARFAGRQGAPLLQTYHDLGKLLSKGAVYSRTTTWVFRAGPSCGLAAALCALTLVPAASIRAPFSFSGDLVLFAYLLGLLRFFTVIAALDTGSSFEGMGASREVFFSALAEPALIFGLAALALAAGEISLSRIFPHIAATAWLATGPALALVAAAILIVFLAENSRIPVDDPNTHLELTMIHEVMVLDHGGPDLAFILYTSSLKLWILGALIVDILLTLFGLKGLAGLAAFICGQFVLAILVGMIESLMARLPLLRVPRLLVGAGVISILAFALVLRFVQ
jgi:formate hydrogenlyase subunit 4